MKKRWIIHLFYLLWLAGCANQMPLEGGPKDVTPPRLLKSVPDTLTTYFSGSRITLSFDEFLVLKDPVRQVVITPPLAIPPQVRLKGKSVEVLFEDSLMPNTTYCINFGKAITDNNEGNILTNFQYVFSTGSYLDSLKVRFQVIDAFTLKPLEGMKVFLYRNPIDSLPLTSRPDYLGLTDPLGNATIDFLPAGSYKIFATDDLNNSLKYDLPGEQIAFSDSLADAGDSLVYKLRMFKERDTILKLKNVRAPLNGRINFMFSGNASALSIVPIGDSLPDFRLYSEIANEAADSIVYWFKPLTRDTVAFQINYPDRTDTVVVKIPRGKPTVKTGKGSGNPRLGAGVGAALAFTVSSSLSNSQLHYFDTLMLTFSRPIDSVGLASLQLRHDTLPIPFTWIYTDSIRRKVNVQWAVIPGELYRFSIPHKAIKDQQGQYLDSTQWVFTTTGLNDYSNLRIKLEQTFSTLPAIFQLLSKEDKLLQSKYLSQAVEGQVIQFERLLAETYKVRLIYDSNGNKQWDTGNYATQTQPERVAYFPQVINVKKGFDLEFNWSKTEQSGNAGRKQ